MAEALLELASRLGEALAAFEPAALSGEDCLAVAGRLAVIEKACAGARARAAARAAACGAHRDKWFADAADWLATVAGSTVGEARSTLDTAQAMEGCGATKAAVAAGELSMHQAGVIVRTEAEVAGSEAELVCLARGSALGPLRDEARRRRLAAVPAEELFERQHRARGFRHWRDDAGMVRVAGALPPVVGVGLMHRLEGGQSSPHWRLTTVGAPRHRVSRPDAKRPTRRSAAFADAETDRVRRAAWATGAREPRAVHAADALVKLLAGGGKGKAARADVVVVCDLAAWRRGHAHAGEPCHLVGGGPLPVPVARAMADDAFVKAVLHDGVRIDTVAHLGRHIPAELRTALELGPAPDFEGVSCEEQGCGRRYGLEWDHVDPRANRGPTSFDNLQARCWPHHRAKTERDRQAGLLGPAMPP